MRPSALVLAACAALAAPARASVATADRTPNAWLENPIFAAAAVEEYLTREANRALILLVEVPVAASTKEASRPEEEEAEPRAVVAAPAGALDGLSPGAAADIVAPYARATLKEGTRTVGRITTAVAATADSGRETVQAPPAPPPASAAVTPGNVNDIEDVCADATALSPLNFDNVGAKPNCFKRKQVLAVSPD